MVAQTLGWLTAATHLAVIIWFFVGALVAARWRRALVPHLVISACVIAVFAIGWDCPLTDIEKAFRRAGDAPVYDSGFIDHYLTGPLVGTPVTPMIRVTALTLWAALTAWGYGRILLRRRAAVASAAPGSRAT